MYIHFFTKLRETLFLFFFYSFRLIREQLIMGIQIFIHYHLIYLFHFLKQPYNKINTVYLKKKNSN